MGVHTPTPRAEEQHRDQGLLDAKRGQGDSTWSPISPLSQASPETYFLATWMGQSQVQVLTSSAEQHGYHPLDVACGVPCAQTKGLATLKPK